MLERCSRRCEEEDEGGRGFSQRDEREHAISTEIALRSSEEWTLRRYLTMDALEIAEKPNPQLSRH
jgi:hypothetical protein